VVIIKNGSRRGQRYTAIRDTFASADITVSTFVGKEAWFSYSVKS
jgi:hypothetical protein